MGGKAIAMVVVVAAIVSIAATNRASAQEARALGVPVAPIALIGEVAPGVARARVRVTSSERGLVLYRVTREVRPLAVPADVFDGGAPAGAAGVRVHRWVDRPRRQSDEMVAFLGASYYRMVAEGLSYGLSARGLAVDTVGGAGEEFPAFTTFWFQRPRPGDGELRFYHG